MSTDLNQLMTQMYAYFQQRYHLSGADAGPGALFLAFEAIGTAVSPGDFKLLPGDTTFNPAIIQQHGSHLVDFVVELNDQGLIAPRGDLSPTVERQYAYLLNTARPPADPAKMDAFLQLQGQAKRTLDEQKGTVSFEEFMPVSFVPQFWFDPAQSDNWTSYDAADAPAPVTSPPSPPTGLPPWRWRLLKEPSQEVWAGMAAALGTHAPLPTHAGSIGQPRPLEALRTGSQSLPGITALTGTSAPQAASRLQSLAPRPVLVNLQAKTVVDLPTAQPDSANFTMSFEYCVVAVSRPWLEAAFIVEPGWFLPGERAGSWSLGKYDPVPQRFGYLPAKLLVIRNLKISATWSPQDISNVESGAAAIGPFSLLGSRFESGNITVPGMQAVGWFCQIMPALPPTPDPAIALL
ncbi:hypothetical protein [Silvimonas amylolytica]|uniref:Uncharacterized protein n=1 Tax=Silvimonas amylolytica TaxID=449663 RepID=A0ABQ2PIP4_9NEIS|nr:hypothetical protein [Silvimonas amylolytica]GGP24892.1 hypothetical protein GCM10010971_07110 [Silvimonas amylolytica]